MTKNKRKSFAVFSKTKKTKRKESSDSSSPARVDLMKVDKGKKKDVGGKRNSVIILIPVGA
jgi:hypothetical protein